MVRTFFRNVLRITAAVFGIGAALFALVALEDLYNVISAGIELRWAVTIGAVVVALVCSALARVSLSYANALTPAVKK